MNNYLIVGGGIAGLSVARLLSEKGIPFVGLEREDRLGGRADIGHHRVYANDSVSFLSRLCTSSDWIRIDEEVRERRKGEWTSLQEKLSDAETFYLRPSFYSTKQPFQSLIEELSHPIKDSFHLKKAVEKVDSSLKKVICQDGSEYLYEKLLWCADLNLLSKLWHGDNTNLSKALKKTGGALSGLNLDYVLKEPLFDFKNSIVFPFRFKERKMRAIGVAESNTLHWLLFLDEEIVEDREEVAKCVRTLKRELQKEFPKLKDSISTEKIVFLPSLSGEASTPFKTLELVSDVIYVGPQASLEDSDSSLMNIDRTLDNAKNFEATLAAT